MKSIKILKVIIYTRENFLTAQKYITGKKAKVLESNSVAIGNNTSYVYFNSSLAN